MATQFRNITPEATLILDKTNAQSFLVHDAIVDNGYVYGVPRATANLIPPHGNNAVFKVKADDYLDYAANCMLNSLGHDLDHASVIVKCGNYLYASVLGNPDVEVGSIIRIDPESLAITSLGLPYFAPDGLASDGNFLYGMFGSTVKKINPSTLEVVDCVVSDENYNDANFIENPDHYSSQLYGDWSYGLGSTPHTISVDATFIYLNSVITYTIQHGDQPQYWLTASRLHKIRKADMVYMGYAVLSQITNEMAQNKDFVFVGHEPLGALCYGYNWGSSAVRKSDMSVFTLPKLSASDSLGNISNGVLLVGNKLIDVKANSHLYVIDATDPSQWSINSDPNDFVLSDNAVEQDHDPVIPLAVLVRDTIGKFHTFLYGTYPAAMLRLVIPENFESPSEQEYKMSRSYVLTGKASYKDSNLAVSKGKKITGEQYALLSTASKALFTSEDAVSQVALNKDPQDLGKDYKLVGSSTSADPVTLVLDAQGNEIELEDNTAYVYQIDAIATRKDIEDTEAVFVVNGGIKRGAGKASVELIGTPRILVLPDGFEDWEISVTNNLTTGGITVGFIGEANKVVHITAIVNLKKSI